MFRIVPQLTALTPRVNPTPTKVLLATCVELMGIPKKAADPRITELAKSLEEP
jgi:hypothetical protein